MALLYATVGDVETLLAPDPAPDDVDRLLTVASRWLRHATRAAVYDTTDAGLPEDDDVADAFRDATVEQVLAWVRTGIRPDEGATGAAAGVVARKSMRSVAIDYAVYADSAKDRVAVATTLCEASRTILADAGLLSSHVTVWG